LSVLFLSVLIFGFAGSGTAGDPHSAYYDQANDRVFWFIQTSDTHIGTSGTQDSTNLNWLVTEARQTIDPSFIIVTGDLTDSTNGGLWPGGPYQEEWDEYKSIVDIPGITQDNYYDIPGNHDAYSDQFFAYYLANSVQGRATGNTQVSFFKEFAFGKYHFLGLNTSGNTGEGFSLSHPYGDPAGLDEDELSFISEEMDYDPADPPLLTLAFGHHPLFPTGSSTDTYVDYGLEEFLALMNQSFSSLYGYGHTHAFEEAFFIPNNSQHDGFFYFNVNSLGESSQNQYTIMAIDCNGLSSKTLGVGNWPAVLITTPLDENLSGYNPYSYTVPASPSNPIRALVFDPGTMLSVQYRIDSSSTWHDMSPVAGNPHLWEASWNAASLLQGQHTIEVAASSALGTRNDLITVSADQGSHPPQIGATFSEPDIGTYVITGRTRYKTTVFVPNNDAIPTFQLGDGVVFRLTAMDEGSLGIPDSTVQITIVGPESRELVSTLSDFNGNAEAVWQTSAPNQMGLGGTTAGIYTATITGATAQGFSWDGQTQTKTFRLVSHIATRSNRSIPRSRAVSR